MGTFRKDRFANSSNPQNDPHTHMPRLEPVTIAVRLDIVLLVHMHFHLHYLKVSVTAMLTQFFKRS